MNILNRVRRRLESRAEDQVWRQQKRLVSKFTMCDQEALGSIRRACDYIVNHNIPGDVVECGVCNGGTAAILAARTRRPDRTVWLFDSFQGMPPTSEVDGTEANKYVGLCVGQEELVRAAITELDFPIDQCVIRKGWFEETFSKELPSDIALLHIDADWYDSVTLCLETLYDRVVEGGIVMLDDFGYWEGSREAFYDFCKSKNLKPVIERAGISHAFWVKGKLHNRPNGSNSNA